MERPRLDARLKQYLQARGTTIGLQPASPMRVKSRATLGTIARAEALLTSVVPAFHCYMTAGK